MKMDEMLKAGLLPDEKILWRGKAEPFTTLDKTHKKRFIICAGIGLLITALVAVAYFAAVARGGLQAKPYVLLIVLLLCESLPSTCWVTPPSLRRWNTSSPTSV